MNFGFIRSHRLAGAAAMLALLSACGPGENDPGPGGVTVGEAKALDEAAAMLEQEKLPPGALDNPAQEPQGTPEQEAQQQGE